SQVLKRGNNGKIFATALSQQKARQALAELTKAIEAGEYIHEQQAGAELVKQGLEQFLGFSAATDDKITDHTDFSNLREVKAQQAMLKDGMPDRLVEAYYGHFLQTFSDKNTVLKPVFDLDPALQERWKILDKWIDADNSNTLLPTLNMDDASYRQKLQNLDMTFTVFTVEILRRYITLNPETLRDDTMKKKLEELLKNALRT